jgi:NAD(P) transhydrogenase subunit alpha
VGYKAVIDACYEFDRIFPMMMTAAGTITPAKVLILGAGVAGLQAVATAKRLGAVVSVFDVRKETKEQVESLGGKFVEVSSNEDGGTNTGYAKEMSEEYKQKQAKLILETISKHDIVITTALIPGKRAPILVTKEMVDAMRPGSLIVDIAAVTGGNCELTEPNEIIIHNGVKIIGYENYPSRVAASASRLYSNNLFNLVSLMVKNDKNLINLEDEIIQKSLITHQGITTNAISN